MLKDLIAGQEEIHSETLNAPEQLGPILKNLKSKGECITAILMFEEANRVLLLFILEDDPYSFYELKENTFSPLPLSEYLNAISPDQGMLRLYLIPPVLFKAILVLAQKKPDIIAGSDVVNIEQLLKRLEEKEKDAVLMLEKEGETSLFHFSGGKLSDSYFENTMGIEEESQIHDQLLIYTYSAPEADSVAITLFYDLNISPACDLKDIRETAIEGIDKPSVSRPVLILLRGEEKVEHILDKEVFTLGRDTKCDWIAQDVAISREHAIIRQCMDGFYIEDQKSRNGTYINKEKVGRQRLSNGDAIQMGPYHFIFLENAVRHNIAPPVSAVPERNDPFATGREDSRQDVPEKKDIPRNWGLEVISGNMAGGFFELTSISYSLGRGNVDIRIKDPQISRHHADIKWTDEGFIVSDRKSANGLFVNDEKVETKQLSSDDIIKVGETRLRVVRKE